MSAASSQTNMATGLFSSTQTLEWDVRRGPCYTVTVHVVGHISGLRDHHLHPGIAQRSQPNYQFFKVSTVQGLLLAVKPEPAHTVTNLYLCSRRRLKKGRAPGIPKGFDSSPAAAGNLLCPDHESLLVAYAN